MSKPPCSPNCQTGQSRSGSSGRSQSSKSRKRNSTDSPSGSANNENGRWVLQDRLRSVLSDPLGLPLLKMLHGENPDDEKLGCLAQKSNFYEDQKLDLTAFDAIFREAVEEWCKNQAKKEPQLTTILSQKIENENKNKHLAFFSGKEVNVDGSRIDILLSPSKQGTPLAVVEVGRHGSEWWAKLSQVVKYLDMMLGKPKESPLQFQKPLLCAVLAIEGEDDGQQLEVKLGVFLCRPKCTGGIANSFRMTLLWHSKTEEIEKASEDFGKLLRVTSDFGRWRDGDDAMGSNKYEYFSSNCCKVGENVFRSYDSRVRPTDRSASVYMDRDCHDIVGGKSKKVFESDDCQFWSDSKEQRLLIISVPYKEGEHFARAPTDFVPIIKQLGQLHSRGYVHGDIRAYNTVFGKEGGLIDFDFSRKPGEPYPKGYRASLVDGSRRGNGEVGNKNNEMVKGHDWYALGRLIFAVHRFKPPQDEHNSPLVAEKAHMDTRWEELRQEPTDDEKTELCDLLKRLGEAKWTVQPSTRFEDALEDAGNTVAVAMQATHRGATGSPPEKKN